MASIAQITANQANAQLSTGPKTPEGKARVAQNALSHGLAGKHLVIRPDEQEEFAGFRRELIFDLAPYGAAETVIFGDLLHAVWSIHRFRKLEAEASAGATEDFTNPETAALLDRLTRYHARARRSRYKALKDLRTLQTARAQRRAGERSHQAIAEAAKREATKQSQPISP
jgi:hypothetical protein